MQHYPSNEIPSYERLSAVSERYPDMDAWSSLAFMNILHTGDEAYRAIVPPFKEHKLSQGRFMLMMQLFDKRTGQTIQLSPAEIADGACVTRATVTGLVDGLLNEGLVERNPDPKDRRRMVIHLSEAGIDLINKLLPIHFRNIQLMLDVLSVEEKKQLIGLLSKVCTRIQEIEPNTCEPRQFCSG